MLEYYERKMVVLVCVYDERGSRELKCDFQDGISPCGYSQRKARVDLQGSLVLPEVLRTLGFDVPRHLSSQLKNDYLTEM